MNIFGVSMQLVPQIISFTFELIRSARQNRIFLWTGFDLDWLYGHPL